MLYDIFNKKKSKVPFHTPYNNQASFCIPIKLGLPVQITLAMFPTGVKKLQLSQKS